MAELPVHAAAPNFVAAIRQLAAIAAYATFFDSRSMRHLGSRDKTVGLRERRPGVHANRIQPSRVAEVLAGHRARAAPFLLLPYQQAENAQIASLQARVQG